MSKEAARIEELRSQLSSSESVKDLKGKLLSFAPSFHAAIQRSEMLGWRDDLGLRVISLDMPYLGLAALGRAETLVALQKKRSSIVRRQTLAHECAHGLLRDVDRSRLGLDREREDLLCNEFARRVLMPSDQVMEYLKHYGFPTDIRCLQQFCRTFKVGFRPAIKVLDEYAPRACPVVLIAATYRGHRKRPKELGFRIDAAATDPDLYAPPERRLGSMGLSSLARWARWAEPGLRRSAHSNWVALRSRAKNVECWYGPADFVAKVICGQQRHSIHERGLLVVLDRTSLRSMSWDPTRAYAPTRVTSPPYPGQLAFAR